MNTTDKKISEVLAKFGEPMAGNVWRVQGTAVIYHKTLERIAAQANVVFDEPKIIRAERDEAVIQVTGRMGERVEWSIGEALIGVNYRVSGKQAAYVYAMAEKRAKDRVILKLIELHGYVYSEEEADEFKQGRLGFADPHVELEKTEPQQQKSRVEAAASDGKVEDDLRAKIKKAKTINAVTDLMLHADTQKVLADLPEGIRDEIRDYAKARLVELGWPTKKAA
ncbi:trna delta -isopentenylpyrophosphate transferase [Microvirga arabica]|uniref:trna delta -isopentenylpyrophosphate transferase n=1 Tax=Microvirga arabica TaxID=1128671 RepID=UPI001939ABBB|nr:trna delta -isopentenylpyrophosphate transferase [Microvirga arabica]MBM1174495.1 trna delta -isopentenylpyrophosphate transferase [Microvirga arabica]